MDIKLAGSLAELGEEWGAEVYDDYSGRGMYGATTAGVTLEHNDGSCLLLNLLERLTEGSIEVEELEDLPLPDRFHTDSMGMGIIIY